MAYTQAQKAKLYGDAQVELTKVALALKVFSEDNDLFVDDQATPEQQQASRDYLQLADLIGRFAIEAKANEASK